MSLAFLLLVISIEHTLTKFIQKISDNQEEIHTIDITKEQKKPIDVYRRLITQGDGLFPTESGVDRSSIEMTVFASEGTMS
jgi:hypothetical protein